MTFDHRDVKDKVLSQLKPAGRVRHQPGAKDAAVTVETRQKEHAPDLSTNIKHVTNEQ